MTFAWTDERIAELNRLFAEGKNGSQIASAIGAPSRSAVHGKIHRLGLHRSKPEPTPEERRALEQSRRERARIKTRLWHQKRAAQRAAAAGDAVAPLARFRAKREQDTPALDRAPAGLPAALPVPPDALFCALLDMPRGGCKFAVSPHDAATHLFCGTPALDGKPYCGFHHGIAFNTVATRQANAAARERSATAFTPRAAA